MTKTSKAYGECPLCGKVGIDIGPSKVAKAYNTFKCAQGHKHRLYVSKRIEEASKPEEVEMEKKEASFKRAMVLSKCYQFGFMPVMTKKAALRQAVNKHGLKKVLGLFK